MDIAKDIYLLHCWLYNATFEEPQDDIFECNMDTLFGLYTVVVIVVQIVFLVSVPVFVLVVVLAYIVAVGAHVAVDA